MANEPQQPMAPQNAAVTLTITMNNGQVAVSGPIENRVLCYGLLEIAKDTIFEYSKKEKSGIVKPTFPFAVQ